MAVINRSQGYLNGTPAFWREGFQMHFNYEMGGAECE